MDSEGAAASDEDEALRLSRVEARSYLRDVLLWRRPLHAALVLLIATAVHQHCSGPQGKPFVALLAEVLLALTFCAWAVGQLSRHFDLRPLLGASPVHLSEDAALEAVTGALSLLGAAEGVLRVTLSGSDPRLFLKVLLSLYVCSLLGRALPTPSLVYLGVWLLFTLPWISDTIEAFTEGARNTRHSPGPQSLD